MMTSGIFIHSLSLQPRMTFSRSVPLPFRFEQRNGNDVRMGSAFQLGPQGRRKQLYKTYTFRKNFGETLSRTLYQSFGEWCGGEQHQVDIEDSRSSRLPVPSCETEQSIRKEDCKFIEFDV